MFTQFAGNYFIYATHDENFAWSFQVGMLWGGSYIMSEYQNTAFASHKDAPHIDMDFLQGCGPLSDAPKKEFDKIVAFVEALHKPRKLKEFKTLF